MRNQDAYLMKRNERFHYERRVPREYADFDKRRYIRKSLKTTSIDVARARRDALVEADDLFWAGVSSAADGVSSNGRQAEQASQAIKRYEGAKRRAMAKGFMYMPNSELIERADVTDLLNRLAVLPAHSLPRQDEAEAVLGIAPKPSIPITQAFEIYCNQIAVSDLLGKSETQKTDWKKIKKRSVRNFVKMHGDLAMDKITRNEAREFYNWWAKRLLPNGNAKPLMPNTANRDLGNLRKLYRCFWEFEGEEERLNPFRNLNFIEQGGKDVPHFEDDWIRERMLDPRVFDKLNSQAICLVYALMETGCRPSEIANILPENIVLDHEVPHIRIRVQDNRQLKTFSSIRDIPLVGVSLIAMQQAKDGFPRYQDKGNLLSVSLLKAFRRRGLFPSPNHRIYSFRHSFEKRMLEAGIDHDLRCLLMGHKNNRPQYGDGGSMVFRRDELLKIMHPVPKNFKSHLDKVCS